MVDQIHKNMEKLSPKEYKLAESLYVLVVENRLENLDVKKLKGHNNIFRVKKGRFRIIFSRQRNENTIRHFGYRNDKTYMAY